MEKTLQSVLPGPLKGVKFTKIDLGQKSPVFGPLVASAAEQGPAVR